jgi:hypothetical protein
MTKLAEPRRMNRISTKSLQRASARFSNAKTGAGWTCPGFTIEGVPPPAVAVDAERFKVVQVVVEGVAIDVVNL